MTATPTLSLLFHILYNAHMHINRQFFVRKQAQSVLISTMLNFGIRWVDLGHVPLPTAFCLQLASVFFRSRYIPAATLLLTSPATYSGFRRCDLYNTNCQLFLCNSAKNQPFFNVRCHRGVRRLLACLESSLCAIRLLPASPRRAKFSVRRYRCRSNSSALPLHADLPRRNLCRSPFMPCSRAFKARQGGLHSKDFHSCRASSQLSSGHHSSLCTLPSQQSGQYSFWNGASTSSQVTAAGSVIRLWHILAARFLLTWSCVERERPCTGLEVTTGRTKDWAKS